MDKNIKKIGKNCIVEEGRGQIYKGCRRRKGLRIFYGLEQILHN